MARVLITGAGGFTAAHLADDISRRGLECVGLTAHEQQPVPRTFLGTHVADLVDADQLVDVLQKVQPEFVVHLAAVTFVAHGNAQDFYQTNVVGTRNLLEAIATLRAPPRMTLLASSANIYGNASVDVIGEETPPAPANDYAVSKLAMEYVASLYKSRFPISIVRPFNYTGRGQSDQFLIPKIVSHALRKAPEIELGNVDVARDFSDVRTIVRCYGDLLGCPAAAGQTLNVCSGRAFSFAEILQAVQDLSGHEMTLRVNPALVRPNEVKVLRGSRARLESLVGPIADIPLAETLRWMLNESTSARPPVSGGPAGSNLP